MAFATLTTYNLPAAQPITNTPTKPKRRAIVRDDGSAAASTSGRHETAVVTFITLINNIF
jgi:hypothetical protein